MRLAYILLCSLGSVAVGYLLRSVSVKMGKEAALVSLSAGMKSFALATLLPFAAINSLWTFSMSSGKLALLPFLGAGAIVTGGASAVLYIRLTGLEPKKAGSLFTSGMFSNISAMAAFVAFTVLGEEGYACVQLFALFEQPLYFLVGFPLSYEISKGGLANFRIRGRTLLEKPVVLAPIGAVVAGFALHASGLEKPAVLSSAASIVVPTITVLFGLALGFTLRITATKRYLKEILFAHAVKFVVVPAVILAAGAVAGLPEVGDGLPFKALLVSSFVPVAFMAAVPPAIYGFDVDLANSAWLTTTLSHAAVLAALLPVIAS